MGVRVYASQRKAGWRMTACVGKTRMPHSRWDYHRYEIGRMRGPLRVSAVSARGARRDAERELG